MTVKDHIDKAGILGAVFAALCCLGVSAVLSVVTAIGLGFLINDAVLLPLMFVSITVVLWGLTSGWRRHGRPAALILGAVASAGLATFSFLAPSRLLAFISIALLIGASLMNVALLRRRG